MTTAAYPTERIDPVEDLLRERPHGVTRAELSAALRVDDRTARGLIERAVTAGHLPVIADQTITREARYRLARRDEHALVNRANAEDVARAISLLRKARGRRLAFEREHGAGLFLDPVPETIDAYATNGDLP